MGSLNELAKGRKRNETKTVSFAFDHGEELKRNFSRVVESSLSLSVGESSLGGDDRLEEPHVDDLGVRSHFLRRTKQRRRGCQLEVRDRFERSGGTYPDTRKGESLDVGSKRAEVRSKKSGKHVDSLVDEVDGRSSRSSLFVHGIRRKDEVRDVGNVCKREERNGEFELFGKGGGKGRRDSRTPASMFPFGRGRA